MFPTSLYMPPGLRYLVASSKHLYAFSTLIFKYKIDRFSSKIKIKIYTKNYEDSGTYPTK